MDRFSFFSKIKMKKMWIYIEELKDEFYDC